MSITLNRELEQIEADIKQSILDGDNFAYSKHLRRKQETQDKLFFNETKNLKAELESLSGERQAAIEVRQDLTAELKQAADNVFAARSRAFDEQEKHNKIQSQLYFLDEKIERERKDIRELELKLQRHVASKMGDAPTMETLTNEDTH